jgi:lipopolysaccharide export system protein LptC
MTATVLPTTAETVKDRTIARWRRRSRVIRALRVLGPASIGLILLGMVVSVAMNALKPAVEQAQESNQPIRLINPHFQGRDAQGKAFIITAITATRDPQEYQKVYLDHPVLVLGEDGPDPTRIISERGIFHENTGLLEAIGHVEMTFSKATFHTESSVFDTKSGELTGSVPIQGQGPLGEIDGKSYAVHDKGATMEFHGRVHTRLNPRKPAGGQ